MQGHGSLRLFRRGPTAEFRLCVLAVIALALIVVDARWREALDPARKVVAVALYPFQRLVLAPRDAVDTANNWLDAASLARSEKAALQQQRIELAQISTHAAQLSAENRLLRRLLNISEMVSQPAVAVEVLYEPPNAFARHLVFNKGSSSGIQPGMPVIDEGGVVGQIVRVTPFTAEAALLTDDNVSIPAQVLRNGLRVIVFGSGVSGKVVVRYLTGDSDIVPGDSLITSGVGGLFPAGLLIAKVDSIERDAASGFGIAVASPMSHPERYRHFLVLRVDTPTSGPEASQEAGRDGSTSDR